MLADLGKSAIQAHDEIASFCIRKNNVKPTPKEDCSLTVSKAHLIQNETNNRQKVKHTGQKKQAARKAHPRDLHQPDLLLQYVDSLEEHGLIDRQGEETLCQDTCTTYLKLYSELISHPELLAHFMILIDQSIKTAGIEETLYFREPIAKYCATILKKYSGASRCLPQKMPTFYKANPETSWLSLTQFSVAHLNYAAGNHCTELLSNELNDLLNLVHVDVRVLDQLAKNSQATKKIKSAIATISHNREQLIHANLRLVVAVARKFKDRGVAYVDLIQEGNIGLIKSAARFDHRKGFKFSTYAHWWIWQSIKLAIAKQRNVVRLPTHLYEQIARLFATKDKLQSEQNTEATNEELAKALEVSVEKIAYWQELSRDTLSFDMPLGEDSDTTFGDSYQDSNSENTEALAQNALSTKYVKKLLLKLDDRERKIIQMRFGIGLHDAYTLDSIAHQVGLTRERVRQIEKEALAKLQENFKGMQQVIDT